MKPILAITICGYANGGKTTIATLIKNTLESHGIQAVINDQEEDSIHRDQKRCLEALAEKETTVVINVTQAMRGALG
jgi:molybdopterin-guanine dinucleotide biosynthesis protein